MFNQNALRNNNTKSAPPGDQTNVLTTILTNMPSQAPYPCALNEGKYYQTNSYLLFHALQLQFPKKIHGQT